LIRIILIGPRVGRVTALRLAPHRVNVRHVTSQKMLFRVTNLHLSILFLLSAMCIHGTAYGANDDGAADLGVDYAFMSLMTLSPDFAAANYTIHNEGGLDVDISIGRLPYHIDLMQNIYSQLQLEIAVAYQRTKEVIPTFPTPGENIDAEWDTYGAGLGLLYEYSISKHLRFTPSLRIGVAKIENHASYNGALTNLFKDLYDGTLFNWETNASVLNLGLGLSYTWKFLDRHSSIKAVVYHIYVDSFDESNAAVKFSENANMLAVKADMVFPTDVTIHRDRLDFVLLLGANNFFGENRRTLGYTTSYQAGIGAEFPLKWKQTTYGHLRLSGQVLWASNMEGWLLTIGFNPE
jgi:hypothetical protein